MQFGSCSDADRVRREAELLALARHPGVVELVGIEGSADRPVLVTTPVDGPTLAAFGPVTTEELAGLMAALASTVADLHDLGLVHGSVDADHVLVDADGRPVLFDFGAGGRCGEVPPGDVEELDPGVDVAALGHLLRRFAMGVDARPLRRLADRATAADSSDRPSARVLAAGLAAAVPGARLPSRPAQPEAGPAPTVDDEEGGGARARQDPRTDSLERRRRPPASAGRRRPAPRVLIGVGVPTVTAVILLALVLTPAGPRPAIDIPAPTAAAASATTATSARAGAPLPPASRPPARQDCPEVTSVLLADVDGDGCLDALHYADGILEATGRRWSLGEAGDLVATGDWTCRGVRTLALLRPSTGEVFPVDDWAGDPDGQVTARPAATVEGGQALRAADLDRDGCHELVVERGAQPAEVLRLPRPQS